MPNLMLNNRSYSGGGDTIQYSTMPTPSVDNLGKIVQFTGTTTSSYTNGYFYKCVFNDPNYEWQSISTQNDNSWSQVKNKPFSTIGDSLTTSDNALKVNTAFTEADARTNITTGETIPTILGKISKFFTDLKTVAFTGSYSDLTNKPSIMLKHDTGYNGVAYQTLYVSGTEQFIDGTMYMELDTYTSPDTSTRRFTFASYQIDADSVFDFYCDVYGVSPKAVTLNTSATPYPTLQVDFNASDGVTACRIYIR